MAINGVRWDTTTELAVLKVWQLLIRRHGWADLDQLRQIIDRIRDQQAANEPPYLEQHAEACDGWKLVAAYHLLRAAEIVAEYTEYGSADALFDPVEQAELHFDRARDAATGAAMPTYPSSSACLTLLLDSWSSGASGESYEAPARERPPSSSGWRAAPTTSRSLISYHPSTKRWSTKD